MLLGVCVAWLFVCALRFSGGKRGSEADLDSYPASLVLLLFFAVVLVCFVCFSGVVVLALELGPCACSAMIYP